MDYLKRLLLMLLALATVCAGVYFGILAINLIDSHFGIAGLLVTLAVIVCAFAAAVPDDGTGPR